MEYSRFILIHDDGSAVAYKKNVTLGLTPYFDTYETLILGLTKKVSDEPRRFSVYDFSEVWDEETETLIEENSLVGHLFNAREALFALAERHGIPFETLPKSNHRAGCICRECLGKKFPPPFIDLTEPPNGDPRWQSVGNEWLLPEVEI